MSRGADRPVRRRRAGFTLVEAVATIIVLSIVGSVSSGIILQATDGYVEASTRAQLQSEMSAALDRLVREIRNIDLDPGAVGVGPDIDDVTATSLDWDDDYQIQLTGSDLELQINGGSVETLLKDVTSFAVDTYDEGNTQLAFSLTGAACDSIRRVALSITAERQGVSVTLRTKIYLRATMTRAKA